MAPSEKHNLGPLFTFCLVPKGTSKQAKTTSTSTPSGLGALVKRKYFPTTLDRLWTHFWWAPAGQNIQKRGQVGTQWAKTTSSGAFGAFEWVEPTQSGGWQGEKS